MVGTPDDLVTFIRTMQATTGGFGTVIGFAHDWADREATLRSWELLARYVVPAINGYTRNLVASAAYVSTHRDAFERAQMAVMNKIMENDRAAAALQTTLAAAAQAAGDAQLAPG